MTKEGLELWFDEFEKTIEEKNIQIEDNNMDETGFAIGTVQGSYIVVNKESTKRYQAHLGQQQWTV